MAEVHAVSSISNIQNLIGDIDRLPIANEIRLELTECLQSISGLDQHRTQSLSVNTPSKFTEVVILINRFAQATIDALGACGVLPFPFGIICKAITTVVGIIFTKDVASSVINRFTAILEADLKAKCRATCTKIAHCISYLQGLPAADQLQQEERNFYLQLMASDVPIHIGLDELLFLGEKIRDMVNIADLSEVDKLFNHVQLYCSLAILRELFLLYRFSIQTTFSVDSCSVKNVLDAQKADDRDVLQFLYKPTTKNVCLFRCCFLEDWPILQYFLRKRGLVPENLGELSGKKVTITSVESRVHMLCHYGPPISKRPQRNLDETQQEHNLELRGGTKNIFTIWSHYFDAPRQLYCDNNLRIHSSDGEPSPALSKWYMLKLQPESSLETPCYMIWLASDYKKCLYFDSCNGVSLTSSPKPDANYFWKVKGSRNLPHRKLMDTVVGEWIYVTYE